MGKWQNFIDLTVNVLALFKFASTHSMVNTKNKKKNVYEDKASSKYACASWLSRSQTNDVYVEFF